MHATHLVCRASDARTTGCQPLPADCRLFSSLNTHTTPVFAIVALTITTFAVHVNCQRNPWPKLNTTPRQVTCMAFRANRRMRESTCVDNYITSSNLYLQRRNLTASLSIAATSIHGRSPVHHGTTLPASTIVSPTINPPLSLSASLRTWPHCSTQWLSRSAECILAEGNSWVYNDNPLVRVRKQAQATPSRSVLLSTRDCFYFVWNAHCRQPCGNCTPWHIERRENRRTAPHDYRFRANFSDCTFGEKLKSNAK